MAAKRYGSDRVRSRPVQKQSPVKKIKRNKFAMFLVILIVAMLVFSGFYVVFTSLTSDDGEAGNPIAVFDTTKGEFKVELYEDKLPITCGNFIKLVEDGFYDGMIFYRILDDFMIQAGRYFPDGSEQQSPYGNIEFESDPTVLHVDGAISMASTGAGVGGSSEFFICDGVQTGLDGSYAAFGAVIEGIEVVRDIADEPHDNSSPAGGGKPFTDIVINSITIED